MLRCNRRGREVRASVAAAAATAIVGAALVLAAAPAQATTAPVSSWSAKAVPVPATDLAYDAARDVLLATVPGSDRSLGNEVVELDPETGAIGRHVHVGSEPGAIAVTDDGTTAYVGLLGAPSIVRVDLATFTVSSTFSTGPGSSMFGAGFVEDLEAAPGRNDVVVASLANRDISPRHVGVWAYDDGVVLPNHTPVDVSGANRIEFGADASTLYGYDNASSDYSLFTLTLDSSGVSVARETLRVVQGDGVDIEFAGGLLYTTNGKVVDPTTHQLVRSINGGGPIEPAPADNRVTFVSSAGPHTTVFDATTGAVLDYGSFDVITGQMTMLVASGTGLATRDGTNTYLLGPSVGGAAVVPPSAPAATVDDMVTIDLPVAAFDIVADPARGVVYATGTGSGAHSQDLFVIDPAIGDVVAHTPIGNNPGPLALSDDGSTLYIGLRASNEVVTVQAATLAVTGRFSLGSSAAGPMYAEDIAVQPGHPGVVAVSLKMCCAVSHLGVAVFDNGVRRTEWVPDSVGPDRIVFGSSSVLYGTNTHSTGFQFFTMSVDAAGVRRTSTAPRVLPDFPYDIELANGTVYGANGVAVDPAVPVRVGRYGMPGAIEPVAAAGRTYVLAGSSLYEYDLARYRLIGSRVVGAIGAAAHLVSVGNTLVGNTTGSHVYIFTPGEEPAPISFVGQASSSANATAHRATIPAGVEPGDGLLMFFASNGSASISNPSGWQVLDTVATAGSTTRVWRRVAVAGDSGRTIRVNVAVRTKANLVIVAYRGTSPDDPVASVTRAAETVNRASHATPFSPATRPGQWAVSYWTHKDSTTTALQVPLGVTARAAGTQTGSGRVTTLVADSGAAVPAGPYGGHIASAAAASTNASMWTILLAPAPAAEPPPPVNQAPLADMAATCDGLTCSFVANGSTDPDGVITQYSWTFGDGATGGGMNATHTFATSGTRAVTLTVTDDDGATASTTQQVTAIQPITFVAHAAADANSTAHVVTIPTTVAAGDALLLFFASNTTATIGDPVGWQVLDTVSTSGSTTRVWRRVATAADAGAAVRVTVSSISKGDLAVVAYRGTDVTDPVAGFARAAETTARTTHVTPTATSSAAGLVAVSYWTHKDSTTTALTAPAGVTVRWSGTQTGAGRVTALLADSGGAIAAGSYGGLTATAAATSAHASTWTILLAPR